MKAASSLPAAQFFRAIIVTSRRRTVSRPRPSLRHRSSPCASAWRLTKVKAAPFEFAPQLPIKMSAYSRTRTFSSDPSLRTRAKESSAPGVCKFVEASVARCLQGMQRPSSWERWGRQQTDETNSLLGLCDQASCASAYHKKYLSCGLPSRTLLTRPCTSPSTLAVRSCVEGWPTTRDAHETSRRMYTDRQTDRHSN